MSATIVTAAPAPAAAKPWYKVLYIQVLIAIVLGAIVGWLWPTFATDDWIKALGDGFIKLIKMVIAPIIFCTVVSGISHIQDARKVGRVGVKALVYFEVVSSFALIIGLVMGNLIQIGHGLAAKTDPACGLSEDHAALVELAVGEAAIAADNFVYRRYGAAAAT